MFTLLSWNVLADAYVRAAYYPATPPHLLARGARTAAIVDRLARSDADVICLQEAEPALVEAANARASRHAAWYLRKGRDRPDGCATFVRGLAVPSVREVRYPDGSGHVALVLEIEDGGSRVAVANTHLKWDPPGTPSSERCATRQIGHLLSVMPPALPWVVCGDLNVTPEDPVNDAFERLGLVDAYASQGACTAVTNGRAKRIDYFWHSPGLVVEALPVSPIGDGTALPSASEPSDHVPIMIRVRFREVSA